MRYLILLLFSFTLLYANAQQRQKVIFDCDLGDDIDDAFAIAMLLTHQDKLDVIGITTCYGRTEDRAVLALKMLYETGQDHIPVYMGRNTSNTDDRANWYAGQYYWAQGFNKMKPQNKPAADFIIESLKKYPNEVVVISVGPVMNLADVIDKDPEALKLAKKVYSMFGSFHIGYGTMPAIDAEWNVRVDIPASQKFVNSGAEIVYAGLDVTAMVKLDQAKRDQLLMRQSPLTNALSGLYVLWENETPTLFDPVAIGMLIYPELFRTEKVHIQVDEKGYTRLIPGKEPNAEIGVQIDRQEFLKRIMDRYMKQNLER